MKAQVCLLVLSLLHATALDPQHPTLPASTSNRVSKDTAPRSPGRWWWETQCDRWCLFRCTCPGFTCQKRFLLIGRCQNSATEAPSATPSTSPTTLESRITYVPGELSTNQSGLLLSTGLSARMIAQSGQFVVLYNSTDIHSGSSSASSSSVVSTVPFHALPDYGATFADTAPGNQGGWIYLSNSEVRKPVKSGGVGAITFNRHGQVLDYKMVLENTTANCGGGRTPWGSYISCEEVSNGVIWQVDPRGERSGRQITLGSDEGGLFESFAYDPRPSPRHYFVTEDNKFGALQRFIPSVNGTEDPWDELHGDGDTTYLVLHPISDSVGTYEWTLDKNTSRYSANFFYPNAEGIDVYEDMLFFVSKVLKTLFILNLDEGTYSSHTTRRGVFDGQPDQVQRILGPSADAEEDELLYFTEDGGEYAGIHARNREGSFFTILEGPGYLKDETTGLAFSPDGFFMYISYQRNGTLFAISRDDGLPFQAKTLGIKYHAAKEAN